MLGNSQFCGPLACVVMLVSTLTAFSHVESAAANDDQDIRYGGLFADAISQAQRRTVKVHGATVGNVEGYGTGIIISDDGRIVTSQGVYLSGNRVRVTLWNGKQYDAAVLRRNRQLQLALLKIDAKTNDYFQLSQEPVGQKGDWIASISNAFKVADQDEPLSVNLGVISLTTSIIAKRSPREIAYQGDLILIDAITSNPGAAGGAIVITDGRLVGMIGKIIESNNTNTRLNYAVPSKLLDDFVAGRLKEVSVDVATSTPNRTGKKVDLGIQLFNLSGPRGPAYIDRVKRGSPAAEAGLRADDLIVTLSGEKVSTIRDYNRIVGELIADQEVIIIVKRKSDLLRLPITPKEKP